jgi:predicted MPP superfamily phosphohydrolase
MEGVVPDERFLLFLSHDPMIIRRGKGRERCADLILSGHTHGGQIRIPWLGALYAPTQGMFPKYDKGLFQVDETTKLYICSGLGTSRIPVRFLNRAQATLVKLVGE